MGKKSKIKKLTDEQYLAYIAGLKGDAAATANFAADTEAASDEARRTARQPKQGD